MLSEQSLGFLVVHNLYSTDFPEKHSNKMTRIQEKAERKTSVRGSVTGIIFIAPNVPVELVDDGF